MLLAIDGLSGTRVDKGGLLWTRLEIFGIDPSPRGPGEAGSQGEVDALAGRRRSISVKCLTRHALRRSEY